MGDKEMKIQIVKIDLRNISDLSINQPTHKPTSVSCDENEEKAKRDFTKKNAKGRVTMIKWGKMK